MNKNDSDRSYKMNTYEDLVRYIYKNGIEKTAHARHTEKHEETPHDHHT